MVTPKLSLCMIVKNEEVMLPDCLESVSGLADEIVLVDTGSTDRTIEIAESHQARVVHFPWRDDFSAARNESLRHASGDWVLVLDADERLQPESRGELECVIERNDVAGVNVWLASKMPDGHLVEMMATRYHRLFRRLPGVEFTGVIHEQILPSIRRLGHEVMDSDITICHLGYAGQGPNKLSRNLQLLEREVAQKPNDPFVLLNLGHTLHGMGLLNHSTEVFRRALHTQPQALDCELQAFAWSRVADNYLLLGAPSEAVKAAKAALAIAPASVLPRYSLAIALARLGEYQRALDEIKMLLSPSSGATLRVQMKLDALLETAGGLLMQLGRAHEAARYYEEAIQCAESPPDA
jgi:predicted Zn-dependent protease